MIIRRRSTDRAATFARRRSGLPPVTPLTHASSATAAALRIRNVSPSSVSSMSGRRRPRELSMTGSCGESMGAVRAANSPLHQRARVHRLGRHKLHRSYPRLTLPPLNLQADEMLSAVVERLLKAMGEIHPKVHDTLESWREDTDLAGLRDPDALEKLAPTERQQCCTLRNNLDALNRPRPPG